MKRTALKKKSTTKISTLKNKLWSIVSKRIRERDGTTPTSGYCCTCNKFCEGKNWQAGHWEADSTGGALLRYHPHNIHGQGGYCCNINRNHQQQMGVEYTFFMINKYGKDYVDQLRKLKQKSIKADEIFYMMMIELYSKENWEQEVLEYLSTTA